MNSIAIPHQPTSPTAEMALGEHGEFENALETLRAAGLSFEIVDRCPADCIYCDAPLPAAA